MIESPLFASDIVKAPVGAFADSRTCAAFVQTWGSSFRLRAEDAGTQRSTEMPNCSCFDTAPL